MLCDDRPAYPMTVVYRLRFLGFLEPTVLQTAVERVMQRHPLLRATVSRTRLGRLVWVEQTNWRPIVQWQAKPNPSGFPHMTYLDLRQETGIRWWVLTRTDGHDLVIQAHHCCVDGIGMDLVVEDLLVSYALALGGQGNTLSLRPLNPQRLLRRGAPKLTSGKFLSIALKQLRGVVGVHQFLARSPAPLMGHYSTIDRSVTTPETFPAIVGHEFAADETQKIRSTAKSLRATINMLLLRDLFRAVAVWRKKWAIGNDEDWLRIAIPINLRGSADKAMPAANSVSMIFPERQASRFIKDDTHLLQGIYRQLWLIKRFQLQYTYLFSLAAARLLPGAMAGMAQADKCYGTSYFSNVDVVLAQTALPRREGRISCGNVVLESVDLASVLRPHVNVGFMAYSYADRLRIGLHYDPRIMMAEQASDLLDLFGHQVRRSMQNKG